jgi:predicted DNA-binding transcriptional regulator AlpA
MRLITRREFRRRCGNIGRTTEWRGLRDDPDWPELVAITPGLSGYIETEVEAFLRRRAARRLPRPERRRERDRKLADAG